MQQIGVFNYQPNKYAGVTGLADSNLGHFGDHDWFFDKNSYSLKLEPTLEHPYTLGFLNLVSGILFYIFDHFGSISELNYYNRVETDKSTGKDTEEFNKSIAKCTSIY